MITIYEIKFTEFFFIAFVRNAAKRDKLDLTFGE